MQRMLPVHQKKFTFKKRLAKKLEVVRMVTIGKIEQLNQTYHKNSHRNQIPTKRKPLYRFNLRNYKNKQKKLLLVANW